MLNNVLLLSASAGAGHVSAALALEAAFKNLGLARNVQHIDSLDYTTRAFRRIYSKSYIDMVNRAPEMLGWFYDYLDTPWQRERRRLFFDRLNTRRFVRMLEETQPDLVVCTHFLPSELISFLRAEQRLRTKHAIVVTDMDVHAMWLCRNFDHYFVAIDEAKLHLSKLGIAAKQVSVHGIPINPVFAQHKDKIEMRKKHGLDPDRTTILLSAGGFGVGNIDHMIASLKELQHPAQVVAICGKNEEMRERVAELANTDSGNRVLIHPVGFTKQMDEYMSASDILLGKPGGLTSSEALAKGLVFVIVNPIPGQEERNSDHLLEEGVAIRCNNLPVLASKIDRLLDDPARFHQMQQRSLAMGRPNSAVNIATAAAAL